MIRRLTNSEDCTELYSLCVSAPDDSIHQNLLTYLLHGAESFLRS